ncbi:hypothetical protein PPL_09299 [Heterostelium album PN500]|uniref:CUE domain-containing protein n=1 Tax=Heterostelium pallidum (strain ATCC 26659 / Pp 5 / PN500) TaxID=670386 RepID=D3BL67_HETP5|nr:hypothetical protein PPL_09299 [Heterostelium album PN500]EFA77801.1 hypothetical protein PPL_09299 [Heterostelium album PN500]|eukprot:XP_020429929.1 hypothetical protein PPL_09299 [Heterostelium album PN500]
MDGKLNTLRLMFPNTTMDQAIVALKTNNWDLDQTIDFLLATTEADEIAKKEEVIPPPVVKKVVVPPIPIIKPAPCLSPRSTSMGSTKVVEHVRLVPKNAPSFVPVPCLSPKSTGSTRPTPSVASLETAAPLSPRSMTQGAKKTVEIVNIVPIGKPIPCPAPEIASTEVSSDDEILKEFLLLEKQHLPVPPVVQAAPSPSPVNVVELPKPSIAQKVGERDLESAQRDISLLKSISNTLRELENEVRNISFESKEHKPKDENNNNNNNEDDDEEEEDIDEEERLLNKLPNIDHAMEQLESIFNASVEKTEKVLKSLKEEIESWRIKDNVKTFTSTIRLELSEMLESIANYINPIPIAAQEEQRLERQEQKRAELEKKLQELKEYNARLEEERRSAIERIEKKQPSDDQELPPPPPLPSNPLPPPPTPNAAPGYYYYDPSAPNVFYYHPLNQPHPPTQPFQQYPPPSSK